MENTKYPYLDFNLPVEERVKDLLSRMTPQEKMLLLPTHNGAVERLGIKEYHVGGEAAHGVVVRDGSKSTSFTVPVGFACTWDEELMKQVGEVVSDEARIYYKKFNERGGLNLWAPTIDMERDPRWGRTEEAYGEDPLLSGKLSAAYIRGMQGDDPHYLKMSAAPKHFYANNVEDGRCYKSSTIDRRNKHEYYLKPFEIAFKEGRASSMMTAYNEINETPAMVNKEVQNIVKDEWGLDGFVVCDGGDFSQTVEAHKYYKTHAETLANGIKAGVDCMTDKTELVLSAANEAFEKGLITVEDLDKAVFNILKLRFRLGQFDPSDLNPYSSIPEEKLCCSEHSKLSRKAAREAVVLLKNDGILPLNKDKSGKVAVFGVLAEELYKDWYMGFPPYEVTPLQGINNKLNEPAAFVNGNDHIEIKAASAKFVGVDKNGKITCDYDKGEVFELYDWGFGYTNLLSKSTGKFLSTAADGKTAAATADEVGGWFVKENIRVKENNGVIEANDWNNKPLRLNAENGIEADTEDGQRETFEKSVVYDGKADAAKIASENDVCIVFVGNHPLIVSREEYDRDDITLPKSQQDLIKSVYEANKNTIVVIVGGYPYAINQEQEDIPAIVYTAPGSQELGNAVADVLFGNYNPGGRLPMTWYKSVKDLPDINDYDIIKNNRTYMYFDKEVLYPFGYGLSYTTFRYSNLKISNRRISLFGQAEISFKVVNNGKFVGDEVVQMYAGAKNSKIKRPVKQLVAFKRVTLQPGESTTVRFRLPSDKLSHWDTASSRFVVEKGDYSIMIGASSQDIRLSDTIYADTPEIPDRVLSAQTKAELYDDYENITLGECAEGGVCVITHGKSRIVFKSVRLTNANVFGIRAACEQDARVTVTFSRGDGEIVAVGTADIKSTGCKKCYTTTVGTIQQFCGVFDVTFEFDGEVRVNYVRLINV